jgi:hypothetical protein
MRVDRRAVVEQRRMCGLTRTARTPRSLLAARELASSDSLSYSTGAFGSSALIPVRTRVP